MYRTLRCTAAYTRGSTIICVPSETDAGRSVADRSRSARLPTQLETRVPYFGDPVGYRVATQMRSVQEKGALCAALTNLQLMPNGDVLTCFRMPPVGNIKNDGIRQVWKGRLSGGLRAAALVLVQRTNNEYQHRSGSVVVSFRGNLKCD